MPSGKTMLLFLSFVAIAWIVWSWYQTDSYEVPSYTLVTEGEGYEIREYPIQPRYFVPYTSLSTLEAYKAALPRLEEYRSGNNPLNVELPLTKPIFINDSAFMVPNGEIENTPIQDYSLKAVHMTFSDASLVEGLDSSEEAGDTIRVFNRPAGMYAVRTFRGYLTEERYQTQAGKLRSALSQDGIRFEEVTTLAVYEYGQVVPYFQKYEVHIKVVNE